MSAVKFRKQISVILIFMVLAICFSACGTSSTNETAEETASTDYSNSMVTGQVTAIDGNSVTLILGDLPENNPSEGAPSGGDSSGETPSGGAPSGGGPSGGVPSGDAPSGGDSSGGAPSGETPSGGDSSGETSSDGAPSGGGPSGGAPSGNMPSGGGTMVNFTANGESITVTVGNDAEITLEDMGGTKDGTIDDIAVDDILEVTFGGSNTVTAVLVKNIGGGENGGGPSDGSGSPDEITNGTSADTIN